MPMPISPHGFRSTRRPGAAAGTCGMPKLVAGADDRDGDDEHADQPELRSPGVEQVAADRRAERRSRRTCSSRALPLARDRSRSGSISGRMPYFAGLKNVACSAIRKSTT